MVQYNIWCRRTDCPDALWAKMSYHPRRSFAEAAALVEYYEEQWGSLYEYQIIHSHAYPDGMREPVCV